MDLDARENLSSGFANNIGADQRFCSSLLESIVSKPAKSKFSVFQLVSVAEDTGLSLAILETPKTGFVATRPININPLGPEVQSHSVKVYCTHTADQTQYATQIFGGGGGG